jgi:hypothetical protein
MVLEAGLERRNGLNDCRLDFGGIRIGVFGDGIGIGKQLSDVRSFCHGEILERVWAVCVLLLRAWARNVILPF